MAGRTARRGAALALAALWWWGALRLALASDAGALEGAVTAGGWGLSLLPVHCMPRARVVGARKGSGRGGERGRGRGRRRERGCWGVRWSGFWRR
ncbi:hypothetical protein ACFV6E_33735 [Streptomyces sp. NPDC059785]|uniref:hypothetical protein n=1 Tax=unclassified Streptomyces TaxID=2593676 RepID=UPI0036684F85